MSTMVMYGTMGNGIRANRADTTANGMSTAVTYGETVSGIGAKTDIHHGYLADGHYYRWRRPD